jgi:hypothetical protein
MQMAKLMQAMRAMQAMQRYRSAENHAGGDLGFAEIST